LGRTGRRLALMGCAAFGPTAEMSGRFCCDAQRGMQDDTRPGERYLNKGIGLPGWEEQMEPLARTIPPIAVDVSPISFGLCGRVCERQMSWPAAAPRRRLTSFAHTSLEVSAVARSGFVVKHAARRFLPALLSAALICPAQPVLADFTQDGPKLVGTGGVGTVVQQGASVALSGDGHTAIVGGLGDNSFTGAAWVFTLSGGVWTQQGGKLVGTGGGHQGQSIALSADGNTA